MDVRPGDYTNLDGSRVIALPKQSVDALRAERDAYRDALYECVARCNAVESDPINAYDRPSSWQKLADLVDACHAASALLRDYELREADRAE